MSETNILDALNNHECPDCGANKLRSGLRVDIAEHRTCAECEALSTLRRVGHMPRCSFGNNLEPRPLNGFTGIHFRFSRMIAHASRRYAKVCIYRSSNAC